MTPQDFLHNKWILASITSIVLACIGCHTFLEHEKITDQSLVNLAMMAIGVLTGSALTKLAMSANTTIPDSTGSITVNVPPKEPAL